MKLSDLTSSQLGELSRLIAQKEKVMNKLRAIEDKIESFGARGSSSSSVTERKSSAKRGPRKGSKPGRLKDVLLTTLKEAGTTGMTIQELADKLDTKPNNLYSWFYTTGKKFPEIKKDDEGKYTLIAAVSNN